MTTTTTFDHDDHTDAPLIELAERSARQRERHDKDRVIDQIQAINRGSDRTWLACFELEDLQRYLDHLQRSLEPRGPQSVWVRPGDTSAVVQRIPAA